MDRKVDKLSYEQRTHVTKHFYWNLLKVFIACVVIFGASLAYLWHWLSVYEKRSVNGAMTAYMEKVGKGLWHEIYEENRNNFLEFNDENTYTRYLMSLYGDRNVSGMTFSYSGGDESGAYYDVYYQQEKLCALETKKPEGSETWVVRTVGVNHTFTFDALEDTSFAINQINIDHSFSHEENHLPLCFEQSEYPIELPSTVRYSIAGFINEPFINLPDGYRSVRDNTRNHYYIGVAPSALQEEEFKKEIEDTAISFCKYITKDGTFYDLNQHLYPNTDFYYAISGFDNQWATDHDSIEFSNVEITDILPIGENAFVGTISLDYTLIATDVSKTYSSTYQLFFIKNSEDNWRMTNLIIISDTSTSDDINQLG